MSYNAHRENYHENQAADFAAAGYEESLKSEAGRQGLIARAHAENRAINKSGVKFMPTHTYCPNGLMALSDKGLSVFKEAHPDILPWNLYKNGPAGQGYYDYNLECTLEKKNELVEAHARFGGWMKTAAEVPLVVKAIEKSVSSRGCGSRRTHVDLWSLSEKYNTPHTLKRRIQAVQSRAMQILNAYDGRGCSLRSVMIALSKTGATGKAAVIATYRSITGKDAQSYREARDMLTKLHMCNTPDIRDGVELHRTENPVFQKMGISVYDAVQKSASGWKRMYLITKGDRSFHLEEGRYGFGGGWDGRAYQDYSTPTGALHAAVDAWKKQDEAARLNREKFQYLISDKVSMLITRQDSYDAGNCRPGTEAWIKQTGVGKNRQYIPAAALLPYSRDSRVANILAFVNKRAGEWLRQTNVI